ncbi:MAG: hypothetical protein LBH69_04045 [Methanomassiliicoccaceae archaeon]|jgi:Flp pilus assembly protein TadD|nr:hypothetical protein [Methanomassiliicoccaceae archaeon]
MDTEKAFDTIGKHIAAGEYGKVRPVIDTIASSVGDVPTLLKCASLLKVVDDEDGCQNILDRVIEMRLDTAAERLSAASALRGLGRAEDAYGMIRDDEDTVPALREKSRMLLIMDEGETALSKIRRITDMTASDKVLLTEILCSIGEFREAHETASRLVKDEDASYASLVNLCTTLMLMGKNKEAVKTARQHLKEDKKDADSLALAAYVMRINGKMSAATAFAHRAIAADHTHAGALETMAFCLIEKSRFIEAKVMAGAINDKSPGHPAAIRILDACRIAKGGR